MGARLSDVPPGVGGNLKICKCIVCSGEAVRLGELGRLRWFRCIDCGAEFNSTDVENKKAEEEQLVPEQEM